MKVLFKILLAIFSLFVLSSIGGYFYFRKKFQAPANQLVVTQLPATTSFSSGANKELPHAVLLVPIGVPGCSRTCYLQFDTGAPYTLLNSNSLAVLRAEFPATNIMLVAQGDSVRNFRFAVGRAQMQVHRIWVRHYDTPTKLPANPEDPFIIGTLGTDVMDGRVLTLDYARQRLALSSTAPNSLLRRAAFVPMSFKERRILLSVGLQGQPKELMFDSGSSAFALMTSQNNWKEMAIPAAAVQKTPVNSWGKTLTAYTVPTAVAMQFGAVIVPLSTVPILKV
ncbi:hypothetical protein GCM10022409_12470 [Hymenobacter glaciei]|uniref:Peptidase A2 domain-containing protein n=1 Tax=Hymenobacter glaciei TaxID=877209 RepID=A0ABP7TQ97_9BACT